MYFKQLIKLAGILLNISKEEFFLKKLENFETQCLEAQQKLWNISLNTKTFVGREKELEHLAKYCFPSEADRKRKVFVVSGSGGMGKSQLVRHFANSYSDRFQFGWWINSDSQSAILNDYVNLATSMELFPIEEDQSSKEITKKLVGLLGTRKDLSGWLIVLDNIEPDDAEDVFKNFIPQKGGLVIITSQSTLKKQLGSEECDPRFGEPMLKLSALSHDEGCTLLEKVSKKERTDAIGQIVDLLGCLPLAVNQAGSFIYENFCPPDEFLVQLKEQELIFFEEDQDFRSVSSTLILSINKIIETKPEAVLYLQKIAFLSPEEIPISVLSSVIEKETLTIEERKIIGMLDNYSIITLEQKGDQFSINRLMQLASRIYCTQEKFKNCPPQKECLEKLIQKMTFLLTEKDMSIADISRRKELMPHIESILSFLTQFNLQNSELTAELLIKYGLICARIGENAQRQKHLEKALQIQETIFGPSAFEIVETLSSLGASYYKIGNTVKAQELLERAKSLFEAKYGKNHPKVGQTLLDLGIVYGDLGNVKKKIELLELSLSIHENHYGSDHFKVSKVLANLGNAYGVIGETQKQKQVLERAIEIKESHYGKDHFEVGKTLTNLALVYGALQDFNRQKELLLRSLAIKEKYYGKDHTSVSTTLFHLGVVCGELGDYENEKLYLTKTLEIREKHFGKNNHQVAVVLSALAESHLRVNEPEKAITLAQSALAIQQNYYKSDNHELGKTIMILGFGYFETKEFIKSKEHLERAISMFQIVYSDQNHPNLTKCQNKIKQVHHLSTLPKDSINCNFFFFFFNFFLLFFFFKKKYIIIVKEYNGWMLKLGGKFVKDFQRRYFTFSKQEQILSWSKTVGVLIIYFDFYLFIYYLKFLTLIYFRDLVEIKFLFKIFKKSKFYQKKKQRKNFLLKFLAPI